MLLPQKYETISAQLFLLALSAVPGVSKFVVGIVPPRTNWLTAHNSRYTQLHIATHCYTQPPIGCLQRKEICPVYAHRAVEIDPNSFLISVVDVNELSASRPGRFTPGTR